MVAPDLDTPGTRARAWAKPMMSASRRVQPSIPRAKAEQVCMTSPPSSNRWTTGAAVVHFAGEEAAAMTRKWVLEGFFLLIVAAYNGDAWGLVYPLVVLGFLALRGERFTLRSGVRVLLGIAGVYTHDVAATKITSTKHLAEQHEYPLLVTMEPEDE